MQDENTGFNQVAAQRWEPRPVDEVIPLWIREPGRRGRLTKKEVAARDANTAAREEYSRMAEELLVARSSADHWRSEAGQKDEELREQHEHLVAATVSTDGALTKLMASEQAREKDNAAAQTFAIVFAQLVHDTKLEGRQVSLDPSTNQQHSRMFLMLGANNDFSVVMTARSDGKVEVAIEEGRVAIFVVGSEGLDEDQRNAIRGYFAKKKLPSATKMQRTTISARAGRYDLSGSYADVLAKLRETNCGQEGCRLHGSGGLLETLQMLGRFLNFAHTAVSVTLGEYGKTEWSRHLGMESLYRFGGGPYNEKLWRETRNPSGGEYLADGPIGFWMTRPESYREGTEA